MPWLFAPHQEGLLFSGKMLLEWGVVVSDASELLFEDIKKLNAQQRTDVPACFIYAPISNLPMTTKHRLLSPPPPHTHCTILFSDQPMLYIFPVSEDLSDCGCCCCVCVFMRVHGWVCICAWKSAFIKSGFYWTVEQVWILQLDHISGGRVRERGGGKRERKEMLNAQTGRG